MTIIAPSILSADFRHLEADITAVVAAGADWIHVDVMDGHFVPNISMGPLVLEAVRQITALPLDVHLMIENADRYISRFAKAGADWISVQAEACPHLHRTVQLVRDQGVKAGVVLNPATALSTLDWVLEDLDLVLLMSVNPGFGGQQFIPATLDKIKALKQLVDQKNPDCLIEVDGGVNRKTVQAVAAAGADAFVAGSAIFGTEDYAATITEFRKLITAGQQEGTVV